MFPALTPPSFRSRPDASILVDCRSEGLFALTVYNTGNYWTGRDIPRGSRSQLITFDMLPDDILLEIFYFDVGEDLGEDLSEGLGPSGIRDWITLVHVCRRWRRVVFQSPRRLNLQLLCTPFTPPITTLDTWPPLPLIIRNYDTTINDKTPIFDNINDAFKHNDRVCQIDLRGLFCSTFEFVMNSAAMLKPFPELTVLRLTLNKDEYGILPDSFSDGTAPRLRSLILNGISFQGLPKLLFSATQLVHLSLLKIPRPGYISPETMATNLSALTSLESLRLNFQCPPPRPARHLLSSLTRSILPSLTTVEFKGGSEYLEVILARIDAPRLNGLYITFFNQLIFDTPHLFQFIDRRPTLMSQNNFHIEFHPAHIIVRFTSHASVFDALRVKIPCKGSDWQLSSLEQVCTSSLPLVSTSEVLHISEHRHDGPHWQDDVENTLWLDLLRPFIAVKNLYFSEVFVPRIASALQELVGGRTTEVLPTLQVIFLNGSQPLGTIHGGIEKFVAERQHTSHPVRVYSF